MFSNAVRNLDPHEWGRWVLAVSARAGGHQSPDRVFLRCFAHDSALFLIWVVSNLIGDKEPLTFAPVNWWAGLLLLAIALDLNKSYVIKHG